MKKVLLIIIASFFSMATVAQAELRVGVAGMVGFYDATGSETYGSKQKADEQMTVPIASIFGEFVHDLGQVQIGFGVEVIPYDIESDKLQNKRWQSNITNEAQVDVSNHQMAYVILSPSEAPIFLKLGVSKADLVTTETIKNLTTKSAGTVNDTYPNADLEGVHLSVGFDHALPEGFFVRAEAGLHEYNAITVQSSSGNNSVTVELAGYDIGLKIGKSF